MNQLVATTALRSLLVRGGGNCNMVVRSVSAAFVVKSPEDITKPMRIHDWRGGFGYFKIDSKHVQEMSSASAMEKKDEKKDENPKVEAVKKDQNDGGSVAVPSYWGIETSKMKITRRDGSNWPWNCFMRRYGCRAMMLETVAAVPGMVGGMLLHLKSIRRFEHSGGWIKALLEEAENERMHLMTMMELVKPKWHERLLVMLVQGIFCNCFFLCYVISPRLAHRIVGYLEEEAIHSYTEFLKDIDDGKIENVAAPAIAIDYWRLPKDASLKDVVTVIRADEAHHRDVNHFASDIRNQGKELREAAAPIGTTADDLYPLFAKYGKVVDVFIPRDRRSNFVLSLFYNLLYPLGLVIRVVLHSFATSIRTKLTKQWKGLMEELSMAEKSLFNSQNMARMLKKFLKEELWNHLQSHEGQEAVVLEGAVVRIDAVVLGEAAVPAGGLEMITGKETTGRGAGAEAGAGAMKDVKGIMIRTGIIAGAAGLVVPALMTNEDASPARRSFSPRKASPERRSKERSLSPARRSRSPRSPSLQKASPSKEELSPERKSNDRSPSPPSPRDKARSQSPYAEE
ncbi:unnamed protein product [Thlaspi arvense]|uniref:Ubiquinol oxidase n=1 Tax=Thlaspi arvense TaxID=13288 RepID=A0AAU9RI65_THLAR|nr:unnamed protein product [Thlaspi arvense]